MTDQREPRPDQARDKDVIRRYEVGADIDGKEVGIHVDGNVLSLHEPTDTTFKKPKFVFVFKDRRDLIRFMCHMVLAVDEKGFPKFMCVTCPFFHKDPDRCFVVLTEHQGIPPDGKCPLETEV